MHLKLICPASEQGVKRDYPENKDYARSDIRARLDELSERGHTYAELDTDLFSKEERLRLYIEHATEFAVRARAAKRADRVARVYQANDPETGLKVKGLLFGQGVPALVAYESEGGAFLGLYPHDDPSGHIVTIREFLDSLLAADA